MTRLNIEITRPRGADIERFHPDLARATNTRHLELLTLAFSYGLVAGSLEAQGTHLSTLTPALITSISAVAVLNLSSAINQGRVK